MRSNDFAKHRNACRLKIRIPIGQANRRNRVIGSSRAIVASGKGRPFSPRRETGPTSRRCNPWTSTDALPSRPTAASPSQRFVLPSVSTPTLASHQNPAASIGPVNRGVTVHRCVDGRVELLGMVRHPAPVETRSLGRRESTFKILHLASRGRFPSASALPQATGSIDGSGTGSRPSSGQGTLRHAFTCDA